ncbi:Oxidoreductase short chain dehydrogenase/reductase family [Acinetobacter baumannii]|nr:Oxidoreductase short chain dehydrogenase/reductase family [Acinetobacter baumannii]
MILFGKKDQPSRNAYAVVTGAGSGIGRSFAVELAKRGGSVVCADINLEAAEETVKLIEQLGQKAFAVQCDVGPVGCYSWLSCICAKVKKTRLRCNH